MPNAGRRAGSVAARVGALAAGVARYSAGSSGGSSAGGSDCGRGGWAARLAEVAVQAASLLCAAVCAALALTSRALAAPQDYKLDPTHSFVIFEVLHFNTSTLRGRFGPLTGEVSLDREAKKGRVQVVIDMQQLSTGLPILDAKLREPDMLAVEANPKAYFVAERFEFDAQGQVSALRGEFTLRGQSQPLTLTAQRFRCYTSPLFRREVCGGDFEAEFKRSSFGITHSLPFVADSVKLKLQVEAIAQQ